MSRQITMGLFSSLDQAEEAVTKLHEEQSVSTEDISLLYRNEKNQVKEMSGEDTVLSDVAEGAKTGAGVGGALGAVAGLAAATGVLPGIGTVLAAGPLVGALGLTGALGSTVAGAVTGGATGGLVGALSGWGLSKTDANKYTDRVKEGEVLLSVHGHDDKDIHSILSETGATGIRTYEMAEETA